MVGLVDCLYGCIEWCWSKMSDELVARGSCVLQRDVVVTIGSRT